jgi:hypothetical protein
VTYRPLLSLLLSLALVATGAHAQGRVDRASGTTVLPVMTPNGQLEALLLLEPSPLPQLPSQRIIRPAQTGGLFFGNGLQLRAGLSLDANPNVGVLCTNAGTVISTVGSLAGHCLLADFNSRVPLGAGKASGVLQLRRADKSLSAAFGTSRNVLGGTLALPGSYAPDQRLLDSLLGPGSAGVDQRNASLVGQIGIGSQGWITIGGTLARVRLIPASELPDGVPEEWNTSSLTVGGGNRRVGGEITGQVIEVPGQSERFTTLGAGVTWRTPWKARVSVGAENLLTRGKNPLGAPVLRSGEEADEEGRVPYVRYQQDL